MKVLDIIEAIEKVAPLGAAADWDVSGVQAASRREVASRVAVMLEPTLTGISLALQDGADFILCHHPLSMQPRFPNKADAYLDILTLLFGRRAWLYSAHTSLDASPFGPVRWLGRELGLLNLRVLEPVSFNAAASVSAETGTGMCAGFGFGFVGDLPRALAYGEFAEALRKVTGRNSWNACGRIPDTVSRVACCPGSGSDFIGLVRAAGAEVFITGDLRYHFALDASELLPRVLDVGHFCLEEEMIRRFALQLAEELFIPVTFYPSRDPLAAE